VTDGRMRLAGGALRGPPQPSAGGGLKVTTYRMEGRVSHSRTNAEPAFRSAQRVALRRVYAHNCPKKYGALIA
jgi:hypothetical protein